MENQQNPLKNESYLLRVLFKAAYNLGYYSVYIKKTLLVLLALFLIYGAFKASGITIEVSRGTKQIMLIN